VSSEKKSASSGDIKIGSNSPVSNSTINTGTINQVPQPWGVSGQDQQKIRNILRQVVQPVRLHLMCVGKGCNSAASLLPAFSGTQWRISRSSSGEWHFTIANPEGPTNDSGDGVRIMAMDTNGEGYLALTSALDTLGIMYESIGWGSIPLMFVQAPLDTEIVLFIGNPK
jgi:hypothetical protein